MSCPGRRAALIVLGLGCIAVPHSAAQSVGRRAVAFGQVELQEYRFATPFPVRSIRQIAIPIGAAASRGRLSADLGGYWAATTLTRPDGGFRRVTGLTDTQLRVAYVFGRDAVVASLVANLPTGRERMTLADFDVLGTVSSSFLLFPVNAYANGGSLTAALAGVLQAGAWNLGLAGSLRGNRTFTPVMDSIAGPLKYRAGVEGRVRFGADRLIGPSRFTAGLTLSGFRDDLYAGLGATRGSYQPGRRWIGELGLTGPLFGGIASVNAWGYRRSAGDTAGVPIENAERLVGANLMGSWVLSPAVDLEPALAFRYAGLEAGTGLLVGGGLGVRARLTRRASLTGSAGLGRGHLDLQTTDEEGGSVVNRTGLTSLSVSVFLRYRI